VTPDEIKRTGLAAIECFNDPARRDEYFETLYEDDVVLHGYTPEPLTPKATVKGFYKALFDAFPDCHVDTEAMYVEGDVLTWRFRFSGTHTGIACVHPGRLQSTSHRSIRLTPLDLLRAIRLTNSAITTLDC
jgi:hypothetical protein